MRSLLPVFAGLVGVLAVVAFAVPDENNLVVAAVQLKPATGASPHAAGVACGEQVASIVTSLLARDESVVARAAEGIVENDTRVDLVVFPEYGMLGNFSTDQCGGSSPMNQGCVEVPAVGSKVDCATESPLAAIACGPQSHSFSDVAVSVNVCERCEGSRSADGPCAVAKEQHPAPAWKPANVSFFNTQVVLRGRTVVQTYRKTHPWSTDCFDTPVVDYRTFNVSGVRFGLFTCFDIAFPQPADGLLAEGVRAFSYSSAIPLIARTAVKVFSALHHATMVNANLQPGQTSVIRNGTVVADCGAFAGTCAAIASV